MELGLAPADYPFSCTGISGYSGGGKKMIAEYESADRPAHSKLDAPKSYGLGLAHKHLPEMQKISGLAHTPAFVPVVCDYYCGMQVLVPLDLKLAGHQRRSGGRRHCGLLQGGAPPFQGPRPQRSRCRRMACTPTPWPAATGWSCT
ncbi:MAG: hypothetical protein ACLVJH_06825 [Faecalibacterium prausnitzii]